MQENLRTEIEIKLKSLKSDIDSLDGKSELLNEQIVNASKEIDDLNSNKELYKKSVELLVLTQQANEENIKRGFETIVTQALHYILGQEHSFELEFNRRGNLQEMNFNIVTPNCKKALDPIETTAGGALDIVSLALRIALMELSRPKVGGFLIIDEGFKQLHPIPPKYLINASKFVQAINKRIGRQVIMITGRPELIENAQNVIELK